MSASASDRWAASAFLCVPPSIWTAELVFSGGGTYRPPSLCAGCGEVHGPVRPLVARRTALAEDMPAEAVCARPCFGGVPPSGSCVSFSPVCRLRRFPRSDGPAEEVRGGAGRSSGKRASAEWDGRGLAPPAGAGRRDGASGPRPCRSSAAEDRTGCCGGSSLRRKRSVRKPERCGAGIGRGGFRDCVVCGGASVADEKDGSRMNESPPRPQMPAARLFVRRFEAVSGGRLPHSVRRLIPCDRRKRSAPFRAGSVCRYLMGRRRFAAFLCCLRPCCAGDRGSVRVRCGYDAASSSLQIRVFCR